MSAETTKGYDPVNLSEQTVLRVVANATIHGGRCHAKAMGEGKAAARIEREQLALVVVQMDTDVLDTARTAAGITAVIAAVAAVAAIAVAAVAAVA